MPQNNMPDPQSAFNHVFSNVYQRIFMSKLGALRPQYLPQNEKQAADLLDLAGKLRMIDEEAATKEAAASMDPFAAANAALTGVLEQQGYSSVAQSRAYEEQMSIKQAALDWAADPDVYNCVLALKADEAEQGLAVLQRQGR